MYDEPKFMYPNAMLIIIDRPLAHVRQATIPTRIMFTFSRSSLLTRRPATNERIPPPIRVSPKKNNTVFHAILPLARASQRDAAAAKTTWKPTVALVTMGST